MILGAFKPLLFLTAILLFVGGAQSAETTAATGWLNNLKAAPIESVVSVQLLWDEIDPRWNKEIGGQNLFKQARMDSWLVKKRVLALLNRMVLEKRILVFSTDAGSKLLRESGFCETETCENLRAFYLPLEHKIYLRNGDTAELAKSLFHELYHAYQFTYRLPVDLKTMVDVKKENTLSDLDESLYLDFFYEAQANWKTMSLWVDPNWRAQFRKSGENHLKQIGLFFIGAGFAHLLLKSSYNKSTNKYLPKSLQISTAMKDSPMGPEAALIIPELVAVEKTHTQLNLTGNLDFSFHAKYGKAIEKAYFGDLPFLFQRDRDDLRIFNLLHDNYYFRLANKAFDEDLACKAIIEIVQKATSPLIGWATLPDDLMGLCSFLKDTSSQQDRRRFLELVEKQSHSIFSTMPESEGTDGTKPSLNILPQITIRPAK